MSNLTTEELNELTWEERERINYDQCEKRVESLVCNLMDELNKMGNEENVGKCFVNALLRTHRTLQQNFFRDIILPCLRDFARRYDISQYDERNQAACKLAKKIEPIIKDEGLPFI